MAFADYTIDDFMDELASKASTPGGGSVAGLNDALSASLLLMVVRLTKDGSLADYISSLEAMKGDSLDLIDEDADSFNQVMDAFKLPKESEEEKKERREKVQAALKEASLTPLDTMKLGLKLLKEAPKIVEKGNPHAVSDAGIAGIMALSGIKAAHYNVLINAASIEDEEFAQKIKLEAEEILNKAEQLAANIEEKTKSELLHLN